MDKYLFSSNCARAASVYNLFLVKQFMEGIPKELDESAVVDGASKFQIFFGILFCRFPNRCLQ